MSRVASLSALDVADYGWLYTIALAAAS